MQKRRPPGAMTTGAPIARIANGSQRHLRGRKQGKVRKQGQFLPGLIKDGMDSAWASTASRLPARNVRRVATDTRPSCRETAHNQPRVIEHGSPTLLGPGRQVQIALAAILTISATSAVLNTNEMMPCTVAVRRMILSVMPTSETWAVMPITNEKYTKSQ